MKLVYLVFSHKDLDIPELQGAFTALELADAACFDATCTVLEVPLDQEFPKETVSHALRCFCPRQKLIREPGSPDWQASVGKSN